MKTSSHIEQVRVGTRAHWATIAAIAITIVAGVLRLIFLARESLWYDEAISVAIARSDGPTFWHAISSSEANMALYYGLLRLFIGLGQSEVGIRAVSALPGVLTIPVIYALGRRILGQREGLIAAVLLTANTFHIAYSQEARSYSLVVLLVSLSCLFFVRAIEDQTRRDWVWYIVAATLSVYSHFFALLVLGSQWASLAVLPSKRVPWSRFVASAAMMGLLCSPLAIYLLKNGTGGHLAWVSKSTPYSVYSVFSDFAGGGILDAVYLLLWAAGFAFMVRLRDHSRSVFHIWRYALLWMWLLLPVAVSYLLSLRLPMFVNRYLIVCLPPFVLLASVSLARIPSKWVSAGSLTLIVILLSRSVQTYYAFDVKEDWRGVTSYVAARTLSQDAILFYVPVGRLAFDYYVFRGGTSGAATILYPKQIDFDWKKNKDPNVTTFGTLSRQYPRLWLLETHVSGQTMGQKSRALRAALAAGYPNMSENKFRGVDVLLYETDQSFQK